MKLRKLARQLAAAAVAGAMTLSLCMPALAETWDMSNTEKYPNGKGSWISVYRYADIDDTPSSTASFWISGIAATSQTQSRKKTTPLFFRAASKRLI